MRGVPNLLSVVAVAVAAVVPAAPAGAQASQDWTVLFFCEDALLGGQGLCAQMRGALGQELADISVTVGAVLPLGFEPGAGAQPPEDVASAITTNAATGAIWVQMEALDLGGTRPCLHLLLPGMLQPLSVVPIADSAGGEPDLGDAAFRIRSLLSASLHPDLMDLAASSQSVSETPMVLASAAFAPWPLSTASPAPAEELAAGTPEVPSTTLEHVVSPDGTIPSEGTLADEHPSVRRNWLRVHAGYSFLSYPVATSYMSKGNWYHAISLRASLLPAQPTSRAAGLEIFLDGTFSFPKHLRLDPEATGGSTVDLDNSQYLVGLGIGWMFEVARTFSVTPAAGLHVGFSKTEVATEGQPVGYTRANASLWTGFEMRLNPARWIAFTAGFAMENLFNYEYFQLRTDGGVIKVFGLSQLRLDVTAGVCFTF